MYSLDTTSRTLSFTHPTGKCTLNVKAILDLKIRRSCVQSSDNTQIVTYVYSSIPLLKLLSVGPRGMDLLTLYQGCLENGYMEV
jgi:hypothetical protein